MALAGQACSFLETVIPFFCQVRIGFVSMDSKSELGGIASMGRNGELKEGH
jgi:hypothetical protein